MRAGAQITSSTDVTGPEDLVDVNVVLGFVQSWKHADIRRETASSQTATSASDAALEGVAQYAATTSSLDVGADITMARAVTLSLRAPIVLSFSQELDDLKGSSGFASTRALADPSGGSLFGVPFQSPTRSGLEYLSAGVNWSVLDQQRDPAAPTWIVGIEGRIAVGTPLHACAQGTPCPDPANPSASRDAGMSPGTDVLLGKSIWSRRVGYIEPYAGLWAQAEFPQGGSDFRRFAAPGSPENPPWVGAFGAGLVVIPYEAPQERERLSADLLVRGAYHARGWDYSELFDALGSSQAASLRAGQGAGGTAYFSGITQEQEFGSLSVAASTTWQTGRFVRFTVGSALSYAQPHFITGADPCAGSTSGVPCPATTSGPSPEYRDIVDRPGNRFSADDTTVIDLWVMGMVIF